MGLLTLAAFSNIEFDYFTFAFAFGIFSVVGGWILLGIVLYKRMPTVGYVFSMIGYPIIQIVICVTLFFFGCLTSLDGNWGHSAPDSWVEEQERRARENPIDPVKLQEAEEAIEEMYREREEALKNESLDEVGRHLQPAGEPIENAPDESSP